ncbi:MAG TPA: tRNA pseudouridine synthase A [Terriglobia bacterium]
MTEPTNSLSRRNIRLLVAYDGTGFHGWQRQPLLSTVQACLEDAIGGIVSEPVKLYGSGRTDAGVHALGQVANFATSCRIPCANLVRALNDGLPSEVRVREADEVRLDFHARYAARAKTYRYRILLADFCSPFLWRFVWHYPYALDRRRMADAARLLAGTHDFTSFAASSAPEEDDAAQPKTGLRALSQGKEPVPGAAKRWPQGPSSGREHRESAGAGPSLEGEGKSMVRTVFASRLLWRERTRILTYEVRGNGFLHHMVRNIMGTLVEVGRRKVRPGNVIQILEARDRSLAGPTAPAQGLCLVRVEY